ncbi:hypothetical protein ACFOWX_06635 [Sphingorhabdus arenilitoris]|uniref:Uncharacterized protein n=1 Tax=Sphingorhabdus arenilitoris TaxID=1490041 RepID=A0ABV8RGL3_9SPHN
MTVFVILLRSMGMANLAGDAFQYFPGVTMKKLNAKYAACMSLIAAFFSAPTAAQNGSAQTLYTISEGSYKISLQKIQTSKTRYSCNMELVRDLGGQEFVISVVTNSLGWNYVFVIYNKAFDPNVEGRLRQLKFAAQGHKNLPKFPLIFSIKETQDVLIVGNQQQIDGRFSEFTDLMKKADTLIVEDGAGKVLTQLTFHKGNLAAVAGKFEECAKSVRR